MKGEIPYSVVIPTYNRAALLAETLKSVSSQSSREWEVILVDDGSTDATADVAQAAGEKLRYVRQANQGVGAARNAGTRLARGTWVSFLDSDDLWTPDKIETDLDTARRHLEAQVLYGGVRSLRDARLSRPRIPPRATDDFVEALSLRNFLSIGAVTVRRECLVEVGGFVEDRGLGPSADWELWVRLAARYRFAPTGAAHLLVREHAANMMHQPGVMEKAMSLAVDRFLADPVAGPRLQPMETRIRSRSLLFAAICHYGCGDTRTARDRIWRAVRLDPEVALQPMWVFTLARSLLGPRWSTRLRSCKRAIADAVSLERM